jgi:trigger factor
MNVELTTGEGLARTLTITVPAETVASHFTTRVEALAKTVKLDGFRPGKVPTSVVRSRLGAQLAEDVARSLIEDTLPKAIKDKNLSVAGQPRVQAENGKVVAEEGRDFSFKAELEILPDVSPKGAEGIKLTKEIAEPGDELVQSALKRLEEQFGGFEAKSGKAEKGDKLTISGQGYVTKGGKEEAFAGGKLENFDVVLGSGSLIPGFEDGLIGSKAGDEVDVNVTFPAEYHAKELAGQPSVFKLKVEKVETPKAEPLTDESVKQLGLESLDKLKDILKKGATRDLVQATEQRLKRQLLDALENSNKDFDLPKGMVQNELQALWRAQINELQQRNLPMEALGASVEEAIKGLTPLAERRVRLGLVLAALAKANKIEVSADDLNAAIQAQIQAAGPQAEQAKQYFARPEARQQLVGPILEDKVTEWLISKADVTEKTVSAEELLKELQ